MSLSPSRRSTALLLLLLAACGHDATGPEPVIHLDIVPAAGGSIAGLGGKSLYIAPGDSARLAAVVTTDNVGSTPAAGLAWASTNPGVADVDATGLLRARAVGTATVTARTTQYVDTLAVTVSSCGAGAPVTLGVDQVQTFPAGAGGSLCVTGAAGDEYALVAFNADLDSTRATNDVRTAVSVTARTITPLAATIADAAIAFSTTPSVAAMAAALEPPPLPRDDAFDLELRRIAARELQPRMAAARAAFAERAGASGLSRSVGAVTAAVPVVGELLKLNTSLEPCDTTKVNGLSRRAGRVVAVSSRAIVVADTLNPAGGFTSAEYEAFAAAFDTLAYPVDVANFGEARDIDGNGGRVVIFFTSAVNAMTPRAASYYVNGFFYERDLYPNNKAVKDGGCGGSNVAEMFYMLVPDPNGTVNGNRFSKSFVSGVTVGVLGHEFQHLINASRRLLVNETGNWEDVWLNEGLSHIAEELLFYKAAGLAPRAPRLDAAGVIATPLVRTAFNSYIAPSNVSRLTTWLPEIEAHSPYAGNDDLETRAATWTFLRYAADRINGADVALWQKLVATTKLNGMANLQAALGVSGSTLAGWFRDWSIANYADGLAGSGLDARYAYRSWNFRSVVGGLKNPDGTAAYRTYPLVTRALAEGVPTTASLRAGGAGYFRFSVGANKTARVTTTLGGNVLVSVVRIR